MATTSQNLRIASEELDPWSTPTGDGNSPAYAFGKRLIDVVIALPVVIFVLPVLMLGVAVVHACLSKGPLFYRQERCGRQRKTFSIVKFRTMTPVSEQERMAERDSESRVFPGAHLIRYSKIDEVPQFVNVLRGEMSVVGPRPHHLQDCLKFEAQVSGYSERHVVKPGITGLAQIREYAGDFRWNCTDSRVEADLEYIRSRTLVMDLMLMFKTFSIVAWKCQQRLLSSIIQIRSPELDTRLPFVEPEMDSVEADADEESRRAA